MEKAEFKISDMEIIVEGIDNLSSNLKVLFSPVTLKRATLITFLRRNESIHAVYLTCISKFGVSMERSGLSFFI